jgi:hypothetical protein
MIYFEDLCDFSIPKIVRALGKARMQLKFFPRIAQLREFILADAEQDYNDHSQDMPLLENFMTPEDRALRREQEREAAKKALDHIYEVIDSKQVQGQRKMEEKNITQEERQKVQSRKEFLKAQMQEIEDMERGS